MSADVLEIPWEQLSPKQGGLFLEGGMGIVVQATWSFRMRSGSVDISTRPVAVKVLKAAKWDSVTGSPTDGALELLQRESRAMRAAFDSGPGALHSDYVVQLHGLARGAAPPEWVTRLDTFAGVCVVRSAEGESRGEDGVGGGQLLALVMRWEEGGSLHDLLHSPSRTWGASTLARLQLCAKIACGLSALHDCPAGELVHGDIKSHNVLLGSAGDPRISDFGLSTLRLTERSCRLSSVVEASAKRGTWQYMAPEMYWSPTAPAAQASRSTDMYALGTLLWEVLSGNTPWKRETTMEGGELSRVMAIREGMGLSLSSPPLPVDLPADARVVLELCLSAERAKRPSAATVWERLDQAAQSMASGVFDVFLSHAWESNHRTPLATEVYQRLTDAGLRVWLDEAEMGANPQESMERGIESSRCVVALLNERYGQRPKCLQELAWAREKGKPVVGCLAEAKSDWFPVEGGSIREVLDTDTHMFADLREAAKVSWGAGNGLAAGEREKLTKAPNALPKVLRLVQEKLRAPSLSPNPALLHPKPVPHNDRCIPSWAESTTSGALGLDLDFFGPSPVLKQTEVWGALFGHTHPRQLAVGVYDGECWLLLYQPGKDSKPARTPDRAFCSVESCAMDTGSGSRFRVKMKDGRVLAFVADSRGPTRDEWVLSIRQRISEATKPKHSVECGTGKRRLRQREDDSEDFVPHSSGSAAASGHSDGGVPPASFPAVFISYAWGGKIGDQYAGNIKARRIKEALEENGIRAVIDYEGMCRHAGAQPSIILNMAREIKNAAAVIICCSETYTDRPNCVRELEYAMSYAEPGRGRPEPPYNKLVLFVNCGEEGFDPKSASDFFRMYMGSQHWFDNRCPEAFRKSFPMLLTALEDCPGIKRLSLGSSSLGTLAAKI